MRVVTERIPTLKSVTVGIWVNVGSRDEQPAQAGYSHFIEHMFFKGTRSRSATEISREIDCAWRRDECLYHPRDDDLLRQSS